MTLILLGLQQSISFDFDYDIYTVYVKAFLTNGATGKKTVIYSFNCETSKSLIFPTEIKIKGPDLSLIPPETKDVFYS
jgi:hypothetical protein